MNLSGELADPTSKPLIVLSDVIALLLHFFVARLNGVDAMSLFDELANDRLVLFRENRLYFVVEFEFFSVDFKLRIWRI